MFKNENAIMPTSQVPVMIRSSSSPHMYWSFGSENSLDVTFNFSNPKNDTKKTQQLAFYCCGHYQAK